jgi:hypothetical protein
VVDFFGTADADKDGFLNKEEIKAAFTANGQTLTDAELDAVFTKADSDSDGKLSLDELKKLLVVPVPPAEPVKPPVDEPTPKPETPTEPVTPPA